MIWRVLALGLLLVGCSHSSNVVTPSPQPSGSGWTFAYSYNVSGGCDNFDFPQVNGAHYCVHPMEVSAGQTITMTFELTGTGTVVPVQADDTPPATLRLFLWRAGDNMSCAGAYQQYRLWSHKVDLVPGRQTISVPVTPENWTDCYGQMPSAAAFQNTLGNLAGVGYTFGGQSFAGHGAYAQGSVHFALISYNVGYSARHKRKGNYILNSP